MSQLPLVIRNCDVSLNLRLDGIQQMFAEKAEPKVVAVNRELGLINNWSIVFVLKEREGEDKLGAYLRVNTPRPTAISCNFVLTYLSGRLFASRTLNVALDGIKQAGYPSLLSRSQWEADETLQQDDALVVSVQVSTPAGPRATSDATLGFLYKSLTAETPSDISFVAFSRRNEINELSGARKYRASSAALGDASVLLNDWLQNKRQTPFWRAAWADRTLSNVRTAYTDPDSDFEDDIEDATNETAYSSDARDEGIGQASSRGSPNSPTQRKGAFSEAAWSDDDSMSLPPSDIETIFSGDASDGEVPRAFKAKTSTQEPPSTPRKNSAGSQPSATPNTALEGPQSISSNPTLIVTGIAAKTWEAILYYMYTGNITFAPLRSEGEDVRDAFVTNQSQSNPDRPAPCSCKSVYRVATEMKLEPLQDKALTYLESRLSRKNILLEYFSKFSSQHKEVKKLEFSILAKHWDEIKSSTAFQELLMDAVSGRRPHVGPAIAEIFQHVNMSVP